MKHYSSIVVRGLLLGSIALSALPVVAEPVVASASGPAAAPATIARLPLTQGFYVAVDTECAQASNATLMLVHDEGINSARTACSFERIEALGPTSFRVQQRCQDIGVEEVEASIMSYEIPDPTSFSFESETGWQGAARFCEQSSLPEPWSSNDI